MESFLPGMIVTASEPCCSRLKDENHHQYDTYCLDNIGGLVCIDGALEHLSNETFITFIGVFIGSIL